MSFRSDYPFDFKLLNDEDNEDNVFYLEDKVKGIGLEIINKLNTAVSIVAKTGVPGPANFHFALKFRPDTVSRAQDVQEVANWKVSKLLDAGDGDGCVCLYFIYTGTSTLMLAAATSATIQPGQHTRISFTIGLDGSKGSRTTNVQLTSKDIPSASSLPRQLNWTLVNHRGKPVLPVQLSFKDLDTILNDGTKNALTLRIANKLKDKNGNSKYIAFNHDPAKGPVSKISFFFDQNESPSSSSLGNISTVSTIKISEEVVPKESVSNFQFFPPSTQDPLLVWRFSPVGAELRLAPVITEFLDSGVDKLRRTPPYRLNIASPIAGMITGLIANGVDVAGDEKGNTGTILFSVTGTAGKKDIRATFNGKFFYIDAPANQKQVLAGDKIGYIQSPQALGTTTLTFLDFLIKDISSNYQTGRTRIHVHFENIPGYWDNTFIVHLDKQPLVIGDKNVGIGTTKPVAKLQVIGDVLTSKTNEELDPHDPKYRGNNRFGSIAGIGIHAFTGMEQEVFAFNGGNGSAIKFYTWAAQRNWSEEKMRIDHLGNVNIGTIDPKKSTSARLTINGGSGAQGLDLSTANQYANLRVIQNSTSTIDKDLHIGFESGAGSCLRLYSNNAETMTIKDGKVGIGADPLAKLHVGGEIFSGKIKISGVSGAVGLDLSSSNQYANLRVIQNSNSTIDKDLHIGFESGSGSCLRLYSHNAETMTIKDGKVGIGAVDPKAKLHVGGEIYSGKIKIFGVPTAVGLDLSSSDQYAELRVIRNALGDGAKDMFIGYGSGTTSALHLYSDNTETITVRNKFVGIGNTDPKYPLHVKGAVNYTHKGTFGVVNNSMDPFNSNNVSSSGKPWTVPISIFADNYIIAAEFNAISDSRVKCDFSQGDGKEVLGLVNKLEVFNYNYKDFVANGNKVKKGFIAQAVEEIFPDAVSMNCEFVPNIYAVPEKTTFENGRLTVSMREPHQLVTGDTVRIIAGDNARKEVLVTIIDDLGFIVDNWAENTDFLFVYGKQVHDFRTLDYNHIFCAGISAIQELSKQLVELKEKLHSQEARFLTLEKN